MTDNETEPEAIDDIKMHLLASTLCKEEDLRTDGPSSGFTPVAPRFKSDLEAILELAEGATPQLRYVRKKHTMTAYYGFGDASSKVSEPQYKGQTVYMGGMDCGEGMMNRRAPTTGNYETSSTRWKKKPVKDTWGRASCGYSQTTRQQRPAFTGEDLLLSCYTSWCCVYERPNCSTDSLYTWFM